MSNHPRRDQERQELLQTALERRWGWSLLFTGWLHLAAFCGCYYLTIVLDYHEAPGYVSIWLGELLAMWAIFRLCGGRRESKPGELELIVRRIWIAYFVLAFNLGSLNTLRAHALFEFFPAMANLASFAFIMMSVLVHGRFFLAVLIMFAASLLTGAYFWHGFLIFAIAWWVVLNGIGISILRQR